MLYFLSIALSLIIKPRCFLTSDMLVFLIGSKGKGAGIGPLLKLGREAIFTTTHFQTEM